MKTNINKPIFDYEQLVTHSLIYVVKEALEITQNYGLPDGHYFNITFVTAHPDVEIDSALLAKYPEEMTIVLQYEFSKLKVEDKGFSVVLSFGGIPSKLYIPFDAIRFFIDPDANFGLQFNPIIPDKQNKPTLTSVSNAKSSSCSAKNKGKSCAETSGEESATVIDFKSLKQKK